MNNEDIGVSELQTQQQHHLGLLEALASKILPTDCLVTSQTLKATSVSGWQLAKHLLLCHTG